VRSIETFTLTVSPLNAVADPPDELPEADPDDVPDEPPDVLLVDPPDELPELPDELPELPDDEVAEMVTPVCESTSGVFGPN
jgi:hypothetical protein